MNIKFICQNIGHWGDVLAIPFFLLTSLYFYNIQNKSLLEYVLLVFSVTGFIMDTFCTYIYFRYPKK